MDIKATLENVKSQLQLALPNLNLQIYSRDISQFTFASQEPIGVITLTGTDFSESPHASIKAQKASIELGFYYMTRSMEDTSIADLSDFVGAIADLEGVSLDYLKSLSHNKDVSIFEVKAFMDTIFD